VAIECYENEVVSALTAPSRDYQLANGAKVVGSVTVADESGLDALGAFESRWSSVCDSLEEISVPALLETVPILRPEQVARALIEREALSLDAHALLESFRRMLREGGGELVGNARVEQIERSAAGWQLRWDGGQLEADLLVNAAGAWGDELATLAGVAPLGLQPLRRSAFLVGLEEDVSNWPLVHRVQGDLYFKPEAGMLMVSPADTHPSPPCDAQPEELDLAVAADRFMQLTNVALQRMDHSWAGLRSFLPDERPAAGFDPAQDDFFWLVGQGGFGIQTAPYLSEVAAGLLKGEDHALAAAIAPDRFR
jgi:D-arginine dehydrogenase